MSVYDECHVRPSHPCIKHMELNRVLSDGSSLSGCVCGMIYTVGSGDLLAVAGHSAPSYKLTAICWQPETLLPYDRLIADSKEYTIVSATRLGEGVLTAVLRPEGPSGI